MQSGQITLNDDYMRFIIREAVDTQNPQHMQETFPGLPASAIEFILNGGAWQIFEGTLYIN